MGNKFSSFNEFLATQSVQVPIFSFITGIILAGILGYILGSVYVKYGRALSNRKRFSENFMLIAMTTMVIITIVKSSLALSLGLVGALSIVRFRAAIKDPEELTYLFLTIAIGLGLGADQIAITLLAFIIITPIIIFRKKKDEEFHNLFLTISTKKAKVTDIDAIISILQKYCNGVSLRRFDEFENNIEATFAINVDKYEQFEKCRKSLIEHDEDLNISFLDSVGVD